MTAWEASWTLAAVGGGMFLILAANTLDGYGKSIQRPLSYRVVMWGGLAGVLPLLGRLVVAAVLS